MQRPGRPSSVPAVHEAGLTAVHGQSRCYRLGHCPTSKQLRLGISRGFILVGVLFLCCTWRRGQIQRSKCEFLSCGYWRCPKLPPDLSLYVELLNQDHWQSLCCGWLETHLTSIINLYMFCKCIIKNIIDYSHDSWIVFRSEFLCVSVSTAITLLHLVLL
jgi:hypothetical protein